MQFVTKAKIGSFDFTEYSLEQIRGALKLCTDFAPNGALVFDKKARDLAERLRIDNLASAALVYMQTAGHLTTRVVSPFNLQTLVVEKFEDYVCDERKMVVQGLSFPLQVGFVNYKNRDSEVLSLLPGTKIIPYDAAFALNVALVSGMTKYVADKSGGKVVPITPPINLYKDAPYDASGLCVIFEPSIAGTSPLMGLDWAHFLYSHFFVQRLLFMESFAATVQFPKSVLSNDEKYFAKTYHPNVWTVDRPKDDIQRLECLSRMQAYRSKDNTGISAMTYGIYGEEFGPDYRLVEKMGSFEIFLKHIPIEFAKYPIRYIADDERELVSAHKLMIKYGFIPKHYHSRPLDGIEPTVVGEYVYSGTVIFHPKCCTGPFTGKLTPENVKAYVAENGNAANNRMAKFRGASLVGFKAHALGLENHIVGMATPHNSVGVMIPNIGKYKPSEIWTTIMIAGFVRNTYLYHRKPLNFMLQKFAEYNAEQQRNVRFMDWMPLKRPIWHPYTKEQRKRLLRILNECDRFGTLPDDIGDMDLMRVVEKAQADPVFQAQLGRDRQKEIRYDPVYEVRSVEKKGILSNDQDYGENLEEIDEPVRSSLTGIPTLISHPAEKRQLKSGYGLDNKKGENYYGSGDSKGKEVAGDSSDDSSEEDSADPIEGSRGVVDDSVRVRNPIEKDGGSLKVVIDSGGQKNLPSVGITDGLIVGEKRVEKT